MRNVTLSRPIRMLIAAAALLAIAVPAAQAAPAPAKSGTSAGKASTGKPGTTTASTPAAPGAVKPSSARVHLSGLDHLDGHSVTTTGHRVHMVTQIAPYIPHQRVQVTVSVGKHVTRKFEATLKHGPKDKYGWLSANVATPKTGHVTVTVQHLGDKRLTGFEAHSYYFTVGDGAAYGSKSWFVQLMQKRLAARHIYIHQTGVYDQQTEWALDAYHRLVGRGQARTFDKTIVNDLMAGKGHFQVRYPHQGRHAEGDLTKQLLALAVGKRVQWIFPISSGKESTPTILGSYQIYRRTPGYLPDGMYYSDFFIRGYAIHGYDPAPDYPASHGCMRLWINDAIPAFDWLALGDWVDVYGNAPYYLGEGDL